MITCKKCLAEKPEDQMKLRAGKPSKVCIACSDNAAAERERIRSVVADARSTRGRKKKAKTTRRKAVRERTPEPPTDEITIEPGLGFKAFFTDDDRLQVNQGKDNLVLSKTEFKVLTAQYMPWCNSSDN